MAILFVTFLVMDEEERELGWRWQVLMLLSWPVSVSRSQGMIVRVVFVDIYSAQWTPDGLVYVVRSRAVSLVFLRVSGLIKEHVKEGTNALESYERTRSEQAFRASKHTGETVGSYSIGKATEIC